MTSKEMRSNPLFMRSGFETSGKWEFPTIYKQDLIASDINLIAYSDTRAHDTDIHRQRGVHFFLDDYRFTGIYNNPVKSFQKTVTVCIFIIAGLFNLFRNGLLAST